MDEKKSVLTHSLTHSLIHSLTHSLRYMFYIGFFVTILTLISMIFSIISYKLLSGAVSDVSSVIDNWTTIPIYNVTVHDYTGTHCHSPTYSLT